MSSVITLDFEKWKAQQVAAGQPVVLDEFVFANVPNLDPSKDINRSEKLPAQSHIVHRQAVNKTGLASENAVAYSVTLGTEVGNFDFNWIGLINKASGVIGMITHAPTQKKIRTANGLQGNVLTRSFLLEFDGAATETAITTTAETWQIDFTARLTGIDEMQRLINTDSYGEAAFFDEGFAVVRQGEQYRVKKGLAYVGGLRGILEFDQTLNSLRNTRVYADFSYQGNLVSQWKTVVKIIAENELKNYVDGAGYLHYVFAVAWVDGDGNVTDLRSKGSLNDRDIASLNVELSRVKQDYATRGMLENGLSEKQAAGDYATNSALNTVNDNANNRLAMNQNGADIQNKSEFVNNLGLRNTVNLAANAYPKTGGVVHGDINAERMFSQSLFGLQGGDRYGMRLTNFDTASFEGNNLELLSWFGIGLKCTQSQRTEIFFNTRTGDIATQGRITSQGDISSQGNLSVQKNISAKGMIRADDGFAAGTTSLAPWGDIYGSTWGDGWLSHWLNATFARKNSGVFSGNGWFKDESTGLMIQWGAESESNRNFNFPHMFSEACFVVLVTNSTSQGSRIDNAFGHPINNSQFFAATKREDGLINGFPITWLAIGR
ncbi:phage tail-collar fiber domain-containing protein [Xenorhabdus anantnagensis]|uniref:Phage tail protein n=1 Tax=Xenorhabdus anantnagensis TaxID=3025875 RepID=A0ABT5LMY2_9GAMM|nr:phage tail protein [Xenorhabdus anantnagensis]MDC9595767.1 phage tail protein [Xenorhabdus anantnagensis]